MADGEFDVVLAIIPEGQDEAAAKTNVLTEAVKQGGEASKGASAAADQLSAADLRRVEALAATVQAMQRQMAAAAEVQRQQLALAQQVQQATGATAVEMARANQVAANVQGLRERTAVMQAQLEVALQGPAAERAWAAAEALRVQVAATGAAPGTAGAAAAEAELVVQRQLQAQLAAVAAARERDAEAAAAEAAAQRRLAESLASLQGATAQTAERTAATRQGVAAEAAYNQQLVFHNALVQAGVAEIGAQGQLVILNEQGAAAIRSQVAALQAEEAELSRVKAEMADTSAPGVFARALGEVLGALKNIVIYGGLIKAAQWFKEGISSATAFETELLHMNTLAGETQQQISSWSPVLLRMAGDVGVGPGELAHALYNVASNGQHGAAALEVVVNASKAAAIGLGDTATVAKAVTGAVNAYAQSGLTAAHATDVMVATIKAGGAEAQELAPVLGRVAGIAATVGVSFDQVGAFIATFTRVGVGADEAVTALRQTLATLELKGAGPAQAALKSVGYSVQALRKDIAENGLAVALIDLIQRFHGNTDALEKVIPNIRALAGVLSVAKSQAGEFRQVADEVKASMGHITAEAYALTQSNPGQVFAQFRASAEAAAIEVGIKLLPQLAALSNWLRTIVREGDTSGWSAVFAAGISVVSVALAGLVLVLQNLPVLLAALTIAMVVNGSAATIWGNVIAWLSLRLEALWATIVANPIGALAVVIGVAVIALNSMVEASRAADQAFLDQSAVANRNKLALAELGREYDVLAQKQGRVVSGPAAQIAGANKNNQVVLSADAGTFIGEMNRINAVYADQVDKAGKDQVAVDAAKLARDRDISALQSHTQALLDNARAAVANEEAQTANMQRLVQVAKDRLDAAAQSAVTITHSPDQKYAAAYGPQALDNLDKAKEAYGRVSGALETHVAALSTAKTAIDLEQQALDRSRAAREHYTGSVVTGSKAAENARFEIEKGIAARELEARSAAVLASAELQGAEAIRQASIVAAADKLIQADRERAKKAGIEVTALEEQRIRASTAALSDQNQIARLNQQIFASGEADHAAAVTNEAKLADARARNTLASQLAAAQLQVENAALKNGIPLADSRVQQLVKETQARVIANQQTDIAVANAKRDLDFAVAQRQAQADLADAQNQNLAASSALADQLEIENRVVAEGAALDKKRTAEIAAQVIGRHLLSDQEKTAITVTKELQTQTLALAQAEARFKDDQSFRSAVREMGQAAADTYQKYGLLSQATQALAIQNEALHLLLQKGETRTLEQIEAELTARQKVRNEQAKLFADVEIQQAEADKLYGRIASIFDTISSAAGGSATKLGQVTSAISGLVQALDKVRLSGKAWSAEWTAAVAGVVGQVGGLFKALDVGGSNNTGGPSSFGGKLPGNYAAAGSIVGLVVGAIIGAYFQNAAAGAQIGAALGGVLGALITTAGDSASAALKAGGLIEIGETAEKLNGAVRDALLGIFKGLNLELAKLGLALDGLPLIDVKIRDNVVRVVVGAVVRTFSSIQDAISFGIAEALKQSSALGGSGLSPEVRAALAHSTATDLQGLESDIALAQKIANYGVPQVVQAINKAVSDFYIEMQRASQLGIDTTKSIAEFARQIQSQKDAILGISKALSPEDQLRADAAAFNQRATLLRAEQELNKADLLIKQADLAAQIKIQQAKVDLLVADTGIDIASLDEKSKVAVAEIEILRGLQAAYDAVLVAIATAQGIIDSIVLISDEELNAALERLRNLAGHGAGPTGPAGPSPAEQLNAELEKLARTNLPASVNAVIDLGLQLADLTKRTREAHASEELLAKARQALIDQAKAQILDPVRGSLLPGQGGTYGQTQLQQAAAAADKAFADADAAQRKLLETTGQRAIAFWQLNDAHLRALNALAEQDIAGLGLPMEATRKKVTDLRDSLGFLWEMFGRGALSAERFVEVLAQLQQQTGNELLGLAQTLLTTIGDTEEAAKVKHALDVAGFELQRIQINYLYQQWKALGLVSAAVQAILDEALKKINAFDSSKVGAVAATPAGATPGSAGLTPAEYAAAVAADKARYLGTLGSAGGSLTADQALQGLAQYELAQQSQLAQQIAKVNADFASYRAVLGDTLQVQRDYALALRSVIVTALQPLQTFLDGLNTSQFSPLKALDQLAASQQTFEKAIAAVRGGDFTHLGDLTGYAQAYLQQALSSLPVGSDEYKRIEARVEAEIRAILAQYGGNPAAPPSGGPGAPPPGGAPPPPPQVNVQPVVDAVTTTAADQLVELKEITRNTRETQQEVYALRRRLDDPVTVFERVS